MVMNGHRALNPAQHHRVLYDSPGGMGACPYNDADTHWLLYCGTIVFFMQAGFALLEAGTVQRKNAKNILLKNTIDACLGAMIWWVIGWPIAYGKSKSDYKDQSNFAGNYDFFTMHTLQDCNMAGWFFQWTFCAAAATIVSGGVAERCKFTAYLCYTSLITAFIYPVAVYWGWSSRGWMIKVVEYKDGAWFSLRDFAGSGIVHMTGGGAALMGAICLGPRKGWPDITPHSQVLMALGTFILWFGWYGFNPGSTLAITGAGGQAAYVAVNTTLAAAAGGLTVFTIASVKTGEYDLPPALNGILAGLVSITAGCGSMWAYGAVFTGIIGGLVYAGTSAALKMAGIDDPLDASPVHFFAGGWGVVAIGFFGCDLDLAVDGDPMGVFYGGDGSQLGVQIVCMLAFAAWTCGLSGILFFTLSKLNMLRVSAEEEEEGLDVSHHGGSAYDDAKTGA